MKQSFWKRLFRRSSPTPAGHNEPADPTPGEIHATMSEEFRGVRRMLRKQAMALEHLLARGEQAPVLGQDNKARDSLMRLATAFFHLDQSLRDRIADSPAHREAVALFWLQLERVLEEADLQMIRERGIPFDARLHRAVLVRETGQGELVVAEILEPGFVEGGRVRVSAKVILGPDAVDRQNPGNEEEEESE